MGENKIGLKSVKELCGKELHFFIPSYQRGYRWTEDEIKALLVDLHEYFQLVKGGIATSKFYCLQPLVVKKLDDKYEVIDGQQRLTTIFLILKFMQEYAKNALHIEDYSLYSLDYETRSNKDFFEKNLFQQENTENLDFLHISQGYQHIKEWFGGDFASAMKKNDIFYTLFGDNHNAQFIWYEIPENENTYTVFKRLNSGKLSLTNSELIKAVILNDEDKEENFNQEDIAREWENIENRLEDDNLWYFINPDPESEKYEATRMDFILETLLLKNGVELKDNFFIFVKCSDLIKTNGWKMFWEDVKATYRTIQTWYDNRELYHYIGFLMNVRGNKAVILGELLRDYAKSDKVKFLKNIKEKCRKAIIGEKELDFSKLQYGKNNKTIHDILLAFNLASTQNQVSETSRYPFKRHFEAAKSAWSLEHIHAQKERNKNWTEEEVVSLKSYIKKIADLSEKDQKAKLIDFAECITLDNLKDEETNNAMMAVFMGEDIAFEKKEDGSFDVSSNFKKDDSLMNLALLQSNKNAALNNKTFPEKREVLAQYENAEHGTQFIPICTRNVFFKHYSPKATNPFIWDRQAGMDYVKAIIKVVGKFVDAESYDNFDTDESEEKYGLKNKEEETL